MEEENVCPTLILPIHNMRNVRAIDYDPVEQLVYWVDGRGDTLRKAHHNGTQSQVFVGNPMEKIYPYDIAVEPFTRVLLWSCARNNIINVTRLDGTQVYVLQRCYLSLAPSLTHSLWLSLYQYFMNSSLTTKFIRLTKAFL